MNEKEKRKDTITIRIAYLPDENGNPIYDLEYMRILLERELEKLEQLWFILKKPL